MSLSRFKRPLPLLAAILLMAVTAPGQDLGFGSLGGLGAFNQPATKVSLISDSSEVAPGSDFYLAIQMVSKEGWHTYWRNPGEVGEATRIEWSAVPDGIEIGKIQWPVPEKGDLVGSLAYFYGATNLLMLPVHVGDTVAKGDLRISGKVFWLECSDTQCVPKNTEVTIALVVGDADKPAGGHSLIQAFLGKTPTTDPALSAGAEWISIPNEEERRNIRIDLVAEQAFPYMDFFPYEDAGFAVEGSTSTTNSNAGMISFTKPVLKFDGAWPSEIRGVFVFGKDPHDVEKAIEATIPIAPDSLAAANPKAPESTTTATVSNAGGSDRSLLLWLWFAFVGGLILNIMPCVLPVISLKILSFVNQSQESPGQVKKLGLIFTLGVLASFLALALIVVGIKTAGGSPTWGQQFQNPVFVICMTVLVLLIALNLFGVFEVTLGGNMMSNASKLTRKEGPAGAFFNGLLVTLLATPCTAPFLGSAVGFAFTQPTIIILMIFLMVGFGMAFPYLVLSFNPALLKFIPKPGPWMEHFKVFMGFPMIAVVVWLWTVTSQLIYVDDGLGSQFWTGIFLMCVAIAAWVFGTFIQRGRGKKTFPALMVAVLLGWSYIDIVEGTLHWRSPESHPSPTGYTESFPSQTAEKLVWTPWSPETEARALATGRPVFIDYTATWCATCKWNKRYAIDVPEVRKAFTDMDAILLKGDYTAQDPRITEVLYRYQRAGVPLNLFYQKGGNDNPVVFPERFSSDTALELIGADKEA